MELFHYYWAGEGIAAGQPLQRIEAQAAGGIGRWV